MAEIKWVEVAAVVGAFSALAATLAKFGPFFQWVKVRRRVRGYGAFIIAYLDNYGPLDLTDVVCRIDLRRLIRLRYVGVDNVDHPEGPGHWLTDRGKRLLDTHGDLIVRGARRPERYSCGGNKFYCWCSMRNYYVHVGTGHSVRLPESIGRRLEAWYEWRERHDDD